MTIKSEGVDTTGSRRGGSYVVFLVGRQLFSLCLLLLVVLVGNGCHTPAETASLTAGIIAGSTMVGAASPANELEQVYYLGVFDPNEQVPTTIYRVRVHGQSSILFGDRFASGWVPAKLIDSLSSQVALDPNGSEAATITGAATNQEANLQVSRKLWVFGPEGFRTVPADYRLTIVMSGDPSKYFSAIDQMLGITTVSGQTGGTGSALQGNLLQAYQKLLVTREQLQKVKMRP
jgi:hypothetical protein